MSYDRSQVVCYCDADQGGGMSVCKKCKEDSLQKFCWFFEKSSRALTCTHLGFNEFCKSTFAINFSNHKHVDEKDIPNINATASKMSANGGHYIDTMDGPRRIYPTEDGPGRREFVGSSGGGDKYLIKNRYSIKKSQELKDAEDGDRSEVAYDLLGYGEEECIKAATKDLEEKYLLVDKQPGFWDLDKDPDMSDLMCEFEKWEDAQMDHCVVGTPSSDHQKMDICHPEFWKDIEGKHPEPFTTITMEDYLTGKWIPVCKDLVPFEHHVKGQNPCTEFYYHHIAGEAHSHCMGITDGEDDVKENPEFAKIMMDFLDGNDIPTVFDGQLKLIEGGAHSHGMPTDEPTLGQRVSARMAGDYSGSLTHEQWDVVAKQAQQDLKDQRLSWSEPINMHVTKSYLNDMMHDMCAAYCHKYGLYLDMSNPNLYTIYKSDGYFISLRDLYRDGVYPLDMNFIMVDGTPQDELDFESFLDQAPKMVSCGR